MQLAIGGAHNPNFDFLVFLRANAAELAILQQLQKLGLQHGIEFRDLVQEQGSAMRHLHPSRLGIVGAGKGASLIAKQFALQQRARDGRTVHFDKRTAGPGGVEVQQSGDNVLARTTFAGDEDREIRAGDPLQLLTNVPHSRRLTKNNRLREAIGEP